MTEPTTVAADRRPATPGRALSALPAGHRRDPAADPRRRVHAAGPRRAARRRARPAPTCTSRSRARTRPARSRIAGMVVAVAKAAEAGARAIVCASTGNTSASAAAYGAAAGMEVIVVLPKGQIARRQAAPGADRRRAGRRHRRQLRPGARHRPGARRAGRPPGDRWSTRSTRSASRARRPPPSRSATTSAGRPTCWPSRSATPATSAPTGPASATTPRPGIVASRPRMWGFQAAGAAPIVVGHRIEHPETVATAIRIGDPASWTKAVDARDASGGRIDGGHRRRDPGRRTGRSRATRASSASRPRRPAWPA